MATLFSIDGIFSNQGILGLVGLSTAKKRVNKILTDVSGILRPSR